MKILKWMSENILFVITLFFLAFIPLYPKIPLIDVRNTWVYIRAEDFLVISALFIFFILLLKRKVSLRTPITMPILIFWIIGAVATLHAVIFIFPTLPNVFSNVAFLSYLRRIEYLSIFFIAYSAIRDKRNVSYIIAVLIVTLLLVAGYGIGQKHLGFPAYLTMNEEFAKGIPIHLSSLSRIPSTFGGHYDLAAYLVLIIPILISLIFGIKKWPVRLLLIVAVGLGTLLMLWTVSRVSFFVLTVSFVILLFLHKKKFILLSLPVIGIIFIFVTLNFSQGLIQRFGNTVKQIDVLVDAKTGNEIGHVKIIPGINFKDKTIVELGFRNGEDLNITDNELSGATSSAIVPFAYIPQEAVVVVPPDTPTGENLPQGTGYINLTLSPVAKRIGDFFYEGTDLSRESKYVARFTGDFLIKRASAYDLSFTTRFQGEWPNAIAAFQRNIFFGSGYSSVSLAVDNNFLRTLGEVGLLGFISYFGIFLIVGIYISKILPEIKSPVIKSFILGFAAGFAGLILNALFIDVFEASKVAYILWFLIGVVVGILHLHETKPISLYRDLKNITTSKYAIIIYISIFTIVIFSPMVRNYFTGDDFTWLRWAADCSDATGKNCSAISKIVGFFTNSDGFFYRPGTKVYFLIMYSLFWLNQTAYHVASIIIHLSVTVLLFMLSLKILRDFRLSVLAAFLFLVLSGYSESIFWISTTGFLFNALFVLLSLLFYSFWEEKNKIIFFILTILSFIFGLMFHELGVVAPFLVLLYKFTTNDSFKLKHLWAKANLVLISPLFVYLAVRFAAHSHWFNGDYSYNLVKLPFNFVGNTIGYSMISLFGTSSLLLYNALRNILKEHALFASIAIIFIVSALFIIYKKRNKIINLLSKNDRRIVIFAVLFFIISLLPFLGLGNITSRYSYLASCGFVLFFVFLIKRLYNYFENNGKDIAFASVTVVLSVFFLYHIIQIQQAHGDWYEAGLKVNNFLISIDGLYADYWSKEHMKFHFVNVPIKTGEAWIFPVGLPDALWFVFRNPNIDVYQDKTVNDAFNQIEGNLNEKVFVFDDDGRVSEVIKKKNIITAPASSN